MHNFLTRLCLVFFILGIATLRLSGQITPYSNKYVVVGVYLTSADAKQYASQLELRGMQAEVLEHQYPGKRRLFYTYVFESKNFQESLRESNKLRSTPGFEDTWVFVVGPSDLPDKSEVISRQPAEEATTQPIRPEEIPEIADRPASQKPPVTEEIKEAPAPQKPPEAVKPKNEPDPFFNVVVHTINTQNQKPVSSTIKITDGEESTLISVIKSNEASIVKERQNGRHAVQVTSECPGYKRISIDVDLDDPVNERTSSYVQLVDDTIHINMELQELQKGDYQIMYNIYFYNDATVMKPQSKFELDNLVAVMKDNPTMRIRVHGHTNGNAYGKIIEMPEENPDFFRITPENKTGKGSAAKLSEQRAITIKRYLETNGIPAERLATKGWGGKKMLYDKDHPLASQNVRVEIEIMND